MMHFKIKVSGGGKRFQEIQKKFARFWDIQIEKLPWLELDLDVSTAQG